MTTNGQLIDLGQFNQPIERADAVHINKIAGKELTIVGYTHTRGKPNKFSKKEEIGEDGKVDYHTITTKEEFKVERDGETKTYNHFFVTPAIVKQIQRVPNVESELANGAALGPCKPVKRTNEKNGNTYWCLSFPKDSDYNA